MGSVDVIGVYSWGLQGGCAVALRATSVLDLIQNSYGCAILGMRPVASDPLITNRQKISIAPIGIHLDSDCVGSGVILAF